jgi:D-cysteine desulfhydrase family pyridoxal phosphate-dependent enzyme
VTFASEALDAVPRVPLASLPTPLEEMPRLARRLGLGKLFVKRDDGTGLAMGGNKARKLEYDFAPILAGAHDVVVTVGGAQSNHAAMTAAAARRLGLDVKLVLGGPAISGLRGNMLLDSVYGAEVRYLLDDDDNDSLAAGMDQWVVELRRDGRRPYALPIGGSTGLGALGYVRAVRELVAQIGPGPFQVVTAVGSCGTFAGLALGARLFAPGARVVGISVSRTTRQIADRTAELTAESAALLGMAPPDLGALECHDRFHECYGVATESGAEAIRTCAQLEGVLLDPVYTGKSMAGLFALARARSLDPDVPVVFLHTGGLPILFAVDLPEEHA